MAVHPITEEGPRHDPYTGLIIRTFPVCDGKLTATLEKAGTPYHHRCDEYEVQEPRQFRYWMDLQAPNAELGRNDQWCPDHEPCLEQFVRRIEHWLERTECERQEPLEDE